jgi:hypothetical protein
MTRLPTPGGDDGSWGIILNEFLSQAHNTDGSLKAAIVGSSQLKPGAVTKADVGLGIVDNTSDLTKPVSNATQTALDAKLNNADLDTQTAALASNNSSSLYNSISSSYAAVPSAASVATLYVDPTLGNDANNGLSWGAAKATIAATLTRASSGFASTVEILLSRGVHNVSATLVIPQGVKLTGKGPLQSQETEIVWTGADDGSYVIRTAGDTSGSDWTWGRIGNFMIRTAAAKPGGGAYTSVNGIYARNIQNASRMHDIRVQNLPGIGIYADAVNGFPWMGDI